MICEGARSVTARRARARVARVARARRTLSRTRLPVTMPPAFVTATVLIKSLSVSSSDVKRPLAASSALSWR